MDLHEEDHSQEQVTAFITNLEARRIKTLTLKYLENIRTITKKIGLNSNQISEIIALLPKLKINKPEKIFSILLPNDTVPVKSVISLVFWFKSLSMENGDELQTMEMILKWIITVYPYIENKYRLNQFYDLIMHYISSYNLCPYVCHLLAFMTRAEDAKNFRVMKILRLNYNSYYLSKEFNGLLFLYKRLRSDFLNFNITQQANVVWFDSPNPELQIEIYKMRMKQLNATTRSLSKGAIFASRPIELLSKEDKEGVTENFYNLFNDDTATYENPMLTQLTVMLFNKDHTSLSRVLFWIDHAIETILPKDGSFGVNLVKWETLPSLPFQIQYNTSALLQTLATIAEFLNQPLPAIGMYVRRVLPFWQPSYPSDALFTPLQHIDISTFSHLKSCISDKIDSNGDEKYQEFLFGLFDSLGQLLNNWLFRMGSNIIASPDKITNSSGIMNEICSPEDNMNIFDEFIHFLFSESYFILSNYDSLQTKVAALRLLDQVAQVPIRHKIALIYLPHTSLIYQLFIDSSPIVINLLFILLKHYFQSFESIKIIAPKIYYSNDMQGLVESFNNIILTISSKLLPSPRSLMLRNNTLFVIPDIVIKHFNMKNTDNTLLLCNHLALAGFVSVYITTTQPETESKNTIYHPLSILEDKTRKTHFLNFLENRCQFTGLTSFLKIISKDTE